MASGPRRVHSRFAAGGIQFSLRRLLIVVALAATACGGSDDKGGGQGATPTPIPPRAQAAAILPAPTVLDPQFVVKQADVWTTDLAEASNGPFAGFDLRGAHWIGTFARKYENSAFLADLSVAVRASTTGAPVPATLTVFGALALFEQAAGAASAMEFFAGIDPSSIGLQVTGGSAPAATQAEPLAIAHGERSRAFLMPADVGTALPGVDLPSRVAVVGFQQGRLLTILFVWTFGPPDTALIATIANSIIAKASSPS